MNEHNVISIDLAKNAFQVCSINEHDKGKIKHNR